MTGTSRSVLAAVVLAPMVAIATVSVARRPSPCAGVVPVRLLAWSQQSGPLHPRWAGCFDVSPGGQGEPASVVQARGELARFELAARTRSASTRENLGVALALAGEPGRGIDTIEGALAGSDDADTLANRAAAHLLLSGQTDSAYALVQALDLSLQALELRPRHPAALFDKALALTALHLDELAQGAWRDYLALDATSTWAVEARAQQDAIAQRLVSAPATFMALASAAGTPVETLVTACEAAPQACRQHVEDVLLGRWGQAFLAGDVVNADASLSLARRLADVLQRRGDRLDVDAVADIDRAVAGREPRAQDLARASVAYAEGRAAIENEGNSTPPLVEAERLFAQAKNPMEAWAYANRVFTEFNTYDAVRLQSIAPELEHRATLARGKAYLPAAGRLFYLAGLSLANRTLYVSAEPLMLESIRLFEVADEPGNLMSPALITANSALRQGDTEGGWRWGARAIGLGPRMTSLRNRVVTLFNAGAWLADGHLERAASLVLDEAMEIGHRAGQRAWVVGPANRRAQAAAQLGRSAEARRYLDEARPDPVSAEVEANSRAHHEYYAAVADAEFGSSPVESIRLASKAIAFFESRKFSARVAALYLTRGRAFRALGRNAEAQRDFEAGVATYEGYRRSMTTDQLRLLSQEVWWDLYEQQILLSLATPSRALVLAERSRTLSLAAGTTRTDTIDPSVLGRQLSKRQRVIYYAVLPHDLATWVVRPDGVRFERVSIDRPRLEQAALAFQRAVSASADSRSYGEQAAALSRILFDAIRDELADGTELLIIPDGALHRVPFAALPDPVAGDSLNRHHVIATAPSATFLARSLLDERRESRPSTLLAVANPDAPDRHLESLAGAAREVADIGHLYPSAMVFSGAAATKSSFVRELSKADVVHFAGHAVSSPNSPMLAHLDFATTSGSSTLAADEIATLSLRPRAVVFLAACQTGTGVVRRGEGVLSLARPFLIAGSNAVIATLWDIDDALSAPFVLAVHERLAKGISPSVALNEAQRSFNGRLPPSVWSAFVVIGGSSTS